MPPSARVSPPPPGGLRGTWLLLVAAVLALLVNDPWGYLPAPPGGAARLVVVVKALLFVAFAAVNWPGAPRLLRAGLVCCGLGLVANGVPSVVYGAMPYSVEGARRAGMTEAQVASGSSGHVPVAEIWWPLRPLADVLPVPGLHLVASVGDLLLLAGILLAAAGLLGARRAGRRRRVPTR